MNRFLTWIVMSGMCLFGSSAVRHAAVAGSFYPSDRNELIKELTTYFDLAEKENMSDGVAAVIVPHAGYVFSGKVAASAYALIPPGKVYEHVFLIGPSHCVYMDYASVNEQFESYDTPMGKVAVDTALCHKLIAEHDCFRYNPKAHDREHCLEVQLPFLQYRLKTMPSIVPIIIGGQNAHTIYDVAMALKPYFNERNLFVVSSDFSHYPSYADANRVDKRTCDAVMTGSPEKFVEMLEENDSLGIANLGTSACGQSAILALLYITSKQKNIEIQHVMYQNSGDEPVYGDHQRVVGYQAFAFMRKCSSTEKDSSNGDKGADFTLTDAEKSALLGIARHSIASKLGSARSSSFDERGLTATLKLGCGAFVTLKEAGSLRGCIGHFGGDTPLYKLVEQMASAAAFEDPRFMPLRQSELDSIDIEISVLSPLKRIHGIDEFTLGKQGIYIKKGYHSGTFLPQVADDTHWTKEEFLGHCAQDKAEIGWDGWKTAELYTYEAVVFGEK